jgi:hypothetical protein
MKRIMTVDLEFDFETKQAKNLDLVPSLLQLFDKLGIRATFFVVGEMAEQYPGLVKVISQKHEIASHSYQHIYLNKLSETQLEEQIVKSKKTLESLGIKVKGFRAPYFVTHPKLLFYLKKHGFEYDSSVSSTYFPGRYNNLFTSQKPYKIGSIIEMPMPNLLGNFIPSGLSYYRLLFPLSKFFKIPYMFYLHPCEFLQETPVNKINKFVSKLYSRKQGKKAFRILRYILKSSNRKWVACEDYIQSYRIK